MVSGRQRPTASTLAASIAVADKGGESAASFCGICCMSEDDDAFDDFDEFDEIGDETHRFARR